MESSSDPTGEYPLACRTPAYLSLEETVISSDKHPKRSSEFKTANLSPITNDDATKAEAKPDDKEALGRDPSSTVEPSDTISHIEKLPNELLSNIFCYLDIEKPSDSALKDEPIFELTTSATANLKSVSRTIRRWRTLAIPLLFKNTRLIVSNPGTERPVFNQIITPFFHFAKLHSLRNFITSFTFLVHDMKGAMEIDGGDRLNNFSQFWHTLFENIDPLELLIVAHPSVLGALTSCHVFLEDAWSFDCPCHYLRLQRSPVPAVNGSIVEDPATENLIDDQTRDIVESVPENFLVNNVQDSTSSSSRQGSLSDVQSTGPSSGETQNIEFKPPTTLEPWELPRAQSSAIFEIRPWNSMLLNEGSFIRAYATYEFWLRQAPSILSDLVGADEPEHKPFISPTIRDLSYIGIFPMERHFRAFAENLPRLDRLYVQLVPRNDILDSPSKMVQVEAEDLWMERNSCYATVVRELFNSPPLGNYKHLKVFESGDAADKEAWLMAVEYVKRAGNEWRIAGDGVFVRDVEEKGTLESNNGGSNDEENNTTLFFGPMGLERHDAASGLSISYVRTAYGPDELIAKIFFTGQLQLWWPGMYKCAGVDAGRQLSMWK